MYIAQFVFGVLLILFGLMVSMSIDTRNTIEECAIELLIGVAMVIFGAALL